MSGAKDRRPTLDNLIRDAKRRRFDVVVCWRLDRLGRNLKRLITLLEEFHALGVAFVSLAEGIDATTPAGKLQMHILGAIAEFERGRIQERVRAGLARASARKAPWSATESTYGDRRSWRFRARRGAHLGRLEVDGGTLDRRRVAAGDGSLPVM